jgi:SAM-dependent methyltransferase
MPSKTEYIREAGGTLTAAQRRSLFELPRRREFLLRHLPTEPGRVLDVGCATGYIAELVRHLGHEVVGVELNRTMAAKARQRGLEVLEHDLEEPLPLPDNSFDLVHACEIIEHLFDTEAFLHHVHAVLAPGGTLVLSTPNLNSLGNRFRVALGRPLPMWGAYPGDTHGGHIRVFNLAKARELLDRTGFRTDEVWGATPGHRRHWTDRWPRLGEVLLIKATCLE